LQTHKKSILILFLIVFVDLVGFGIIIPLLPFYAERFDATPLMVGIVMATYSLAQLIAAPFWGQLSDRTGRRPVFMISLAGVVASYVWLGFADSLATIIAARALGGFMAGNITAAFAYIADVTPPEDRARGMGIIGAAFGLGFIAGPAIGGALAGADPATADYQTPSFAAAGLSFAALFLTMLFLKESLPTETRQRAAHETKKLPIVQLLQYFRSPQTGMLIFLSFLATFVFAGMESTFAMWSERTHQWGPAQNGYLFAFVGILIAAIQGGLIGPMTRRYGEARMVLVGALALATGLAMIPFSQNLYVLFFAMAVLAVGFSIMTPTLNSLISLQADDTEQGAVMGAARSATTLSRVLGPVFAGFVFWVLGKDWPYWLGAILMVLVAYLVWRYVFAILSRQTAQ
jgi:DHA1 family tetracycline resistance protein-like MFS transporter